MIHHLKTRNHFLKSLGTSYGWLVAFLMLLTPHSPISAHSEDERSHQVITISPDASGANLQFDLFCGPKLSWTLMMALEMSKRNPEFPKGDLNPTLSALFEKNTWIEVHLGDLTHPKPQTLFRPTPIQTEDSSREQHLEAFQITSGNLMSRHKLFTEPSKTKSTKAVLALLEPGRVINTWTPENHDGPNPLGKFIRLTYRYRLDWPKSHPLERGITLAIDTTLKVYTSNSVFAWDSPLTLQCLPDQLVKEQQAIEPKNFLQKEPSNQHKLRRGMFFIAPSKP